VFDAVMSFAVCGDYHHGDDVHGIDVENMTLIIQAISKAVSSLVNGTDTPVLYMKYEEYNITAKFIVK